MYNINKNKHLDYSKSIGNNDDDESPGCGIAYGVPTCDKFQEIYTFLKIFQNF